ncbi:MAG: GNAT family N-acetyltransferase [Sphingobium sp.]|jgi:RimJ/RimL family protein N-acetyltransferase|nr:MAG: GNAT family N-acetyltransferase [Sphingobium sp.]
MFARTKRLLLRPGWLEDAPALAAAIGDEAVLRNLARAPSPYHVEDAESFLSMAADPLLPLFLIFSRTRGAPRLVGGCGLLRDDAGRPELGYWIARPYWGLGFATEAARAVMGIARATGIKGVVSSHMLDNPASGNVLRKVGFRPTGRILQRHSAGRNGVVACAEFEQGEEIAMPSPLHEDLYTDTRPLAA